MTYRTEFPDFDPATLPAIPKHWEDTSWHNNSCPSFSPPATCDVEVFIDYADEALREIKGGKRFAVLEDCNTVRFDSDDWDEVQAFVDDYLAKHCQHVDDGRGRCGHCGQFL